MSLILCAFFCMFGVVTAGQRAFSDDLSLLQEHAHALPQQQKWPDIGKIVDKVKEKAEKINETVKDTVDQAANATADAINSVVEGLREGLDMIDKKADTFENSVRNATDEFLKEVDDNPDLHTFAVVANQTLDALGEALSPIASALTVSSGTVRNILERSGYKDLSKDVDSAFTLANGAINEANSTMARLKQKMFELEVKVNESTGNLSSEIDDNFKYMSGLFDDLVDKVNGTFVANMLEAYETLSSRLKESVEGILPTAQLNQVVESLSILDPIVKSITGHVADPIQNLDTKFDTASGKVRENMPKGQQA